MVETWKKWAKHMGNKSNKEMWNKIIVNQVDKRLVRLALITVAKILYFLIVFLQEDVTEQRAISLQNMLTVISSLNPSFNPPRFKLQHKNHKKC